MGQLASAIYRGEVLHARRDGVAHRVRLPLYMLYLDLAELPRLDDVSRLFAVDGVAVASFYREDYLAPHDVPLDEAVRARVEQLGGARPTGPIRMLTQVRTFGYVFNPVTFYYCYGESSEGVDTSPQAVLAEITNTPWKERHCYLIERSPEGDCTGEFDKRFHVSPFMPMGQRYRFRFSVPGEKLSVGIENLEGARKVFEATLSLRRQPFDAGGLRGVLLRHPAMSLKAHAAIYGHALALYLKRAQFYPHPRKLHPRGASGT